MNKEFELVAHPQFTAFNMLLVRLQNRAPHLHKEMEIGLIINGELELVVANQKRTLTAGDMYVLNPMEVHEFHMIRKSALILAAQVSRSFLSSFFHHDQVTYFAEINIRSFFKQDETRYDVMKGLFIELAYNYFEQSANYEYKCMSLINMILYNLHTYIPKVIFSDTDYDTYQKKQDRINRITDYIEEHFTEKLLLSDISKQEHLSLTYLSHLFKDDMNMTFQQYLNLKRLERAVMLLHSTNKKILTISIESGFSDVRYLNQTCQKYYGCSFSCLRNVVPHLKESFYESNTQNFQTIFNPSDGILLLHSLRESYQKKYCDYTIWELYK